MEHRPREEPVEQQELHRRLRVDCVLVRAQVGLVRRAAAQRRGPSGAPERVAVARAEQPGRHVGALEAATDREEPPTVVTAHGRVDDAVARGGAVAHPAEELVTGGAGTGAGPAAHLAVRRVQRLPELRRQRFARAACVLPRRADRARDRPREGGVLREQRGHRRRVGLGTRWRPRRRPSRRGARGRPPPRRRGGLRAAGGSARRGGARCPRRARRSVRSSTATRRCGSARAHLREWSTAASLLLRVLLGQRAERGCGRRHRRWRRRAPRRRATPRCPVHRRRRGSTCPWTHHPGSSSRSGSSRASATRVSPPGTTHTSRPSFTANGRRSRWRAPMRPSTKVGAVDSATGSCAIQPRGSASTFSRRSDSTASVAAGPITMPFPPEPSTGLNTSSSSR